LKNVGIDSIATTKSVIFSCINLLQKIGEGKTFRKD